MAYKIDIDFIIEEYNKREKKRIEQYNKNHKKQLVFKELTRQKISRELDISYQNMFNYNNGKTPKMIKLLDYIINDLGFRYREVVKKNK